MKQYFWVILVLLLGGVVCVFSSCNHSSQPVNPDSIQDGDIVHISSTITTVQPMTGLVMWPSHGQISKYKGVITLEYSYVLPCRVVTGKEDGVIQYDWSYVEDILNDIASRNHQAILRFRYEYPNNKEVDGNRGTTAVPAYIKALPDYNETYNANAGGDGQTYYADWSNSELQWFTKQFYTDFAARYNNDPRIAFMEVGFGHWSEYHIYGTKLQLGTNFPSHAYQTSFLQHVDSVFTLPFAISIDAADDDYTPIVHNSQLMALPFGLFDDSFMHEDHEGGYNEDCWKAIGKGTRWQRGVCGGEISYYTSQDQRNFLNPAGMYGHTWEEQAAKYHITFMIANDAPGSTYGTTERFQEAGLASGYRFQVLSCITNSSATTLRVTNNGVAPIYHDAYFAIGEHVSTTSLKQLLPQDTITITFPCHCNSGDEVHVVCDHLLAGQEIGFDGDVVL